MLSELDQKHLVEIESLIADQPEGRERIDVAMRFLHSNRSYYHWVGVYILKGSQLHVGPYYGPKTDHTVIPVGRGVCGSAVDQNKNQVVEDVTALDNYLSCNMETKSEIVVLVRDPDGSGRVVGQIDIDGTEIGSFANEEPFLEAVALLIGPSLKILQNLM